MELTRHEGADGFLAHAGEFLGAREAEHNLILGLTSRLRVAPLLFGEPAYFAVVEEGGRVVGVDDAHAAAQPDPLGARRPRGDRAAARGRASGVRLAPRASSARRRRSRSSRGRRGRDRGRGAARDRTAGLPRRPRDAPAGVSGRMRDYERQRPRARDPLVDAFAEEALPEPPPGTSEEFVDRREEDPDGGIVFWEDDGAAVSMAGFGGRTPNGNADRAGLHAARAARPRLRERAHRGGDAAAARRRPALLLPLHRPRQPDLEQHLPADRLRAGR